MIPIMDSLEEAREWFLNNSDGNVICRKADGTVEKVSCYPEAEKFYTGSN